MITLDSTLKSLEIILGGAITTNQLPWVVAYGELETTTFGLSALAENDGVSNGGTAVTLIAAPAAGHARQLKFLSVQNADTVAAVTTIRVNNNGTFRTLWKGTLNVGDILTYTDDTSFLVVTNTGAVKTIGAAQTPTVFPFSAGSAGVAAQNQTVYLGTCFWSATESAVQVPVPSAITLSQLQAAVASAVGGAGQTVAFTLRKNGVDTAITCTINSGSTTASDSAHTVSFAAGDLVSIKVVLSATTGNAQLMAGVST